MAVSRLNFAKSETRDLAEHARLHIDPRRGEQSSESLEWHMSNSAFFTAFVVIAAVLAVLALIAR